MALTQQNLVLTNLGSGQFRIAIGPETYTFGSDRVKALKDGLRDLDFLLFQAIIVLQQAGVNPNNSTFAQIKAAVEAQTYWWGN